MENKKEMTIPNVSAATDAEQSLSKCTDNSIVNQDTDFKGYEQSFEEMQREILRQLDPSYLKTVSMTTLYDTVFEVQTPLIDGLLQRGTYLFVGSPKVGKSFMMAQLAYHISTGTPLWDYKVRKATVLYFALEDDYPRLQKRLFQMFGAEEAGDLYFATESKTVNGGLEEQIRGFMQEHPDTGLIIIDTLKRVREAGGADYSYASDYDIVARLKALADSYKVTMLIVHHTRKQKAEDIFDMISGTNGLMGAADGAFVLSKEKRTSNNATLDVAGRDQQDMKIHLVRDTERKPIGVWGQRHKRYLREHKRAIYTNLLTSGKLNSYLADIDEQAEEMFFRLVEQMAEREGVTEQFKAANGLEWTRRMNNIRACAMELVNKEIIYN